MVLNDTTTNSSSNNTGSVKPTDESFSFTLKFVSAFFLIIIIVLALLGNAVVIRAFAVFRKLRNVTNYFVISLAVTDILVAVFSMPVVASISHLLLISIERYICISSPLKYHTIVTIRKTRIAISTTWFFALTMTVIKLFLSSSVRVVRVYQFVAFSLCFATPVLGMSFAYIMIFRVSRTQAKKLTLRIGEKTKKFCLPKELKAAKTLGVVIGGFLLCWFPFFLLNMSYALCSACGIPVKAVLLAKGLHFSNSVLNPIIYGLMNKQFKTAFRHLFRWTFYSLYGSSAHIIGANVVRKSSSLQTRLSFLKRSLGSGHSNCTANGMRSSPL
ncbi:Octopamine receptor beta-1R [Acropora cervicornis]|uniref:Octopamine receptor beta-1R n=1 Tax=Acropora cervicornis TaxID=6130 RepID=A0AAD9V215_ACRCE|nr:Octopamine receptor beta-1R [Acropora cervicornis]